MDPKLMILTAAFLISTITLAGSNWLMNKPQPLKLKLILPYTLIVFYAVLFVTVPEHRLPLGFLTVGMIFAALGDTLLGINMSKFLAQGIGSFCVGYTLFSVAFLLFPTVVSANVALSTAIGSAGVVGGIFLFIVFVLACTKGSTPPTGVMKTAVLVYGIILFALTLTAAKIPFLAGGAALLFLCDTLIARSLFCSPNANLETETLFPYNLGHWVMALVVASSI